MTRQEDDRDERARRLRRAAPIHASLRRSTRGLLCLVPRRANAAALTVLGAVALLFLMPSVAAAAEGGIEDVKDFATKLTNYVTAVAASVAVLFMAISGVRWTMSAGNPMRQSEARNGLVSAATGLAIALSANLIVTLVIAALK